MTSAPSRIAASVVSTLSVAGRRADLDDDELLRAQVLQVRGLVLAAALRQQLDDRILAVRPLRAAFGHGEIELAQVHAAQVIREVGRGELAAVRPLDRIARS